MARKAVVLLLLCLIPGVQSAGAGPRISFSELEHDFGDVRHGQCPETEFTCTNTGDHTLVLERIGSSCGCAKAMRGSRTIPPGASSKIQARIETLGMSPGRHSKTLDVHSTDPERPTTTLKLTFNLIRHLTIDPEALAVSLLARDKDAVFALKATNNSTEPITPRGPKTDDPGVVTLTPSEVVVPPGEKRDLQLSVRLKQGSAQSRLRGIVMIETCDPVEKIVPVPYFINLPRTGQD